MDTTARLAEQNNGQSWRDCNEAGLVHRMVLSTAVVGATYWRCTRCPVGVRKENDGTVHEMR